MASFSSLHFGITRIRALPGHFSAIDSASRPSVMQIASTYPLQPYLPSTRKHYRIPRKPAVPPIRFWSLNQHLASRVGIRGVATKAIRILQTIDHN